MGIGISDIKKALEEPNVRRIIISVLVIGILLAIVGYCKMQHKMTDSQSFGSSVGTSPGNIESTPGTAEVSKEYASLLNTQNAELAEKAMVEKKASIPTLSRATYNSGFFDNSSDNACSVEELRKARIAGVQASELRCRGCSIDALRSAGFTAGELRNAGFSAIELRKAGFSSKELRDAGFSVKELTDSGFPMQELLSAGFPIPISASSISKNGICSIENIKKARMKGRSASDIRKIGCSLSAMKLAGFTASELKKAGYNAKELRDAGFSAKDLRNAGFSSQNLKDAGFTAGELRDAGFSVKDLKNAGFGAEELKAAGFTAGELKNAGFSAEELKTAGFTDGDLARAGFDTATIQKPVNDTQISAGSKGQNSANLYPPNIQQQGQQISSIAVPESLSKQDQNVVYANQMEVIKAEQKRADQEAKIEQEKQISRQEYQDRLQKKQQFMTGQAQELFGSWGQVPNQQYVSADKQQIQQGQGISVSNQQGGQQTGILQEEYYGPIYKAGTVMFAILDTGINSDEQSPVMATITHGPLKGSVLIGTFQRVDKKVLLQFTTINIPSRRTSIGINAVAIDQDKARTALANRVNNHYMVRYGTLFAASFVDGIGDSLAKKGTTTTSIGGIINVTQRATDISFKDQILIGLGQVGKRFASAVSSFTNIPPTVEVDSGYCIGLLIMSDFKPAQ